MIKMLIDNIFTKASEKMKYSENILLLLIIANIVNFFYHEKYNELFNNIDNAYFISIVTFLDICMVGVFVLVEISLIFFCVYGFLYGTFWEMGMKLKGEIAEKLRQKGFWLQGATHGCQITFFSAYQYLIIFILLINLLQPEILTKKIDGIQSYVQFSNLNFLTTLLISINVIAAITGSLNLISRIHYRNFHFVYNSGKRVQIQIDKFSDRQYVCNIEE